MMKTTLQALPDGPVKYCDLNKDRMTNAECLAETLEDLEYFMAMVTSGTDHGNLFGAPDSELMDWYADQIAELTDSEEHLSAAEAIWEYRTEMSNR